MPYPSKKKNISHQKGDTARYPARLHPGCTSRKSPSMDHHHHLLLLLLSLCLLLLQGEKKKKTLFSSSFLLFFPLLAFWVGSFTTVGYPGERKGEEEGDEKRPLMAEGGKGREKNHPPFPTAHQEALPLPLLLPPPQPPSRIIDAPLFSPNGALGEDAFFQEGEKGSGRPQPLQTFWKTTLSPFLPRFSQVERRGLMDQFVPTPKVEERERERERG